MSLRTGSVNTSCPQPCPYTNGKGSQQSTASAATACPQLTGDKGTAAAGEGAVGEGNK